jgi:26S proteasome non-ATPase regulatory subunit 10
VSDQLPLLRALLAEDPKLVNTVDMVYNEIDHTMLKYADIIPKDERTPLHWAASSGSIEIVQFLIDQGAEVDKTDASGWTPLHIAGGFHTLLPFRIPP